MDSLHRDFQSSMTLLASLDTRATASHTTLLDAVSSISGSSSTDSASSSKGKIEESSQQRALDAARHVKFLRLNAVAEAQFMLDATSSVQRGVQHELAKIRARLGQLVPTETQTAVSDSLKEIATEFNTLLDSSYKAIGTLEGTSETVPPFKSLQLTNGLKNGTIKAHVGGKSGPKSAQTSAASFSRSENFSCSTLPNTPGYASIAEEISTSPLTPLPPDFEVNDQLQFSLASVSTNSELNQDQQLDVFANKSPDLSEQEYFTPPPFEVDEGSVLLPEASITSTDTTTLTTNALTNAFTKVHANSNDDSMTTEPAPSTYGVATEKILNLGDKIMLGTTNGHARPPILKNKSLTNNTEATSNPDNSMENTKFLHSNEPVETPIDLPNFSDEEPERTTTQRIIGTSQSLDGSSVSQTDNIDSVLEKQSNQDSSMQNTSKDTDADHEASHLLSNNIKNGSDKHNDRQRLSVSDVNSTEHTASKSKPTDRIITRSTDVNILKSTDVALNQTFLEVETVPISQRRSRRTKPSEESHKNPVARAWQKLNDLVGPHYASSFVKHRIDRYNLPAEIAFPIIERAQSWEQLVSSLKTEIAKLIPGFNPEDKDEFDRVWERRSRRRSGRRSNELAPEQDKVKEITATRSNELKSVKINDKINNTLSSENQDLRVEDNVPVRVPGKRGRPKGSTKENIRLKKQKQRNQSGSKPKLQLETIVETGSESQPEPKKTKLNSRVKSTAESAVNLSSTRAESEFKSATKAEAEIPLNNVTKINLETENTSSRSTENKTKFNIKYTNKVMTRSSTRNNNDSLDKSVPNASAKPKTSNIPKSKSSTGPDPNLKESRNAAVKVKERSKKVSYDSDKTLYCICQRPSFGQMVACDWETCPYEWYHLRCLNMRRLPPSEGKWYCPHCVKLHGPPLTLKQELEQKRKQKEMEKQEVKKQQKKALSVTQKKASSLANKPEPAVAPLRRSLRKR